MVPLPCPTHKLVRCYLVVTYVNSFHMWLLAGSDT